MTKKEAHKKRKQRRLIYYNAICKLYTRGLYRDLYLNKFMIFAYKQRKSAQIKP